MASTPAKFRPTARNRLFRFEDEYEEAEHASPIPTSPLQAPYHHTHAHFFHPNQLPTNYPTAQAKNSFQIAQEKPVRLTVAMSAVARGVISGRTRGRARAINLVQHSNFSGASLEIGL